MITSTALKAKMVAGTALVLLFGSGVVIGLAWDQTASASTPREVRSNERREEGGRRRLIVDNVGLSTVQKTTVDSLVVFHRQRMADLDTEFQPRYRAVIDGLIEDIKEVLTSDQLVKYEVLLTEHDAAREERRRRESQK